MPKIKIGYVKDSSVALLEMEAFESKGLVKVNLGKTKVVVSGAEGEVPVSKVNPCGICGKQVMANSVLCVIYGK